MYFTCDISFQKTKSKKKNKTNKQEITYKLVEDSYDCGYFIDNETEVEQATSNQEQSIPRMLEMQRKTTDWQSKDVAVKGENVDPNYTFKWCKIDNSNLFRSSFFFSPHIYKFSTFLSEIE